MHANDTFHVRHVSGGACYELSSGKHVVSHLLHLYADNANNFEPQADVNVSLTAMGLLWNAADLLSKMQLRSEAASGQSDAAVLSSDDFEELLRLLLGALQVRTPLTVPPSLCTMESIVCFRLQHVQ